MPSWLRAVRSDLDRMVLISRFISWMMKSRRLPMPGPSWQAWRNCWTWERKRSTSSAISVRLTHQAASCSSRFSSTWTPARISPSLARMRSRLCARHCSRRPAMRSRLAARPFIRSSKTAARALPSARRMPCRAASAASRAIWRVSRRPSQRDSPEAPVSTTPGRDSRSRMDSGGRRFSLAAMASRRCFQRATASSLSEASPDRFQRTSTSTSRRPRPTVVRTFSRMALSAMGGRPWPLMNRSR